MKVLVTGASWKIGLAAVYSLSRGGFEIVGTDDRRLPFNIYSRHLISHYVHAPFYQDKFFEDILSIIKKEKPDIFLPIGGTKQISLHKNEILKNVNSLIPDYESFCKIYDKRNTYNICMEVGISVPERYTDAEADWLLENKKINRLVIKPDYDIGSARGLNYVNSINELNTARKEIRKKYGNYIIEEFIPGGTKMRAVQLIFDKDHNAIASFTLKKLHQYPVAGGITTYAVSTHEPELLEFIMPFFSKCKWEGPLEIELIIDERDGKPKLIEINPRFAGSIVFAIRSGVDFPALVCNALLKKENFKYNYEKGNFYINLSYYLKGVFKEFLFARNKTAFLSQVFKELKQKKVGITMDKKDFPVYLAKILWELKNNLF